MKVSVSYQYLTGSNANDLVVCSCFVFAMSKPDDLLVLLESLVKNILGRFYHLI